MTAITFTRNISSVSGRTIMPIFLIKHHTGIINQYINTTFSFEYRHKSRLDSCSIRHIKIQRNHTGILHCRTLFYPYIMLPSCRSQAYTIAPSPAKRFGYRIFRMPCAAPVMIHTLFSKKSSHLNSMSFLHPNLRDMPVTQADASDNKYIIAQATSSGFPYLLSGYLNLSASYCF